MKAILLAAGYGTRLYPLTEDRPKALLPVAGRPLLDWIADQIDQTASVDEVHVVTNAKFAAALETWAQARSGRLAPVVHNDGTWTNDDRLGAIGDISFVIEEAGLAGEDLLVVAGDNLFEFSLEDYIAFWRERADGSAVTVRDIGSLELARQYAVVELDADGRLVSFVEKPADPASTLVATATYIYHREHVPLVAAYLAEGNPPDAPGNFIAWLHTRRPVYAYRMGGAWFDIGDYEQLRVADNWLRAHAGLPARSEYALGG
jgi:glucose-1-phosphate thymidylyltransferase